MPVSRRVVVAHALRSDSRRTTVDHAVCFSREPSPSDIEFVNLFGPPAGSESIDLLILTYDLLALRNTPYWPYLRREILRLSGQSRKVIFFPQDDYTMCDELDDLYLESSATHVFTPITRDLQILYPQSVEKVEYHEALTGYLDDEFIARSSARNVALNDRSIDVGQRVRNLPPVFGREAQEKARLAIEFGELAARRGFRVDVSTRPEDVLLGDEWSDFLLNSRFTVGRLGGASICDPRGHLADRLRRQMARNPNLSDRENGDRISWRGARYGDFSAISPRIFEAAALGVCQVLVADRYVEGLEPGDHYVPLAKDLSNVDDVFNQMRKIDECQEIVANCRALLVDSGDYTYKSFTARFWGILGLAEDHAKRDPRDAAENLLPFFVLSVNLRNELKRVIVAALTAGKRSISEAQVSEVLAKDGDTLSGAVDPSSLTECLDHWLLSVRRRDWPIESLVIPWEPAVIAADDLRGQPLG